MRRRNFPCARTMRTPGRLLATALALLLPTAVAVTAGAPPAPAAVAPYTWHNAEIGGGGFVPGIVFNPAEPGLVYARTDIGGAYRWNPATGRWLPLLDAVGWTDWGHNGVVSLATDPVDPNRVYAAAGMYTNSWDPNTGAVLRSADRGATWQAAPLPFKLGGNMPGRGMGERLAIDPNRNQRPVPRRAQRQRALAQHGLRCHVGEGDQLPQPRQLRARPERPVRLLQRQRRGHLGDVRPVDRHPRQHDADDLRRRRGQGEPRLPQHRRRGDLGAAAPASPPGTWRTRASSTRPAVSSTSRPATPAAPTTARRATSGSTPRRPAPGRGSARSRPTAPTTTSATAA